MRRGFTLVEVLVAMLIGAVILTLAATVFSAALAGRDRLRAEDTRLTEERRAFEIISRDLHSAIVPPDDSGLQFGLTTDGATVGTNILQFATIVGEPLLAQRPASETALIQYSIIEDPVDRQPSLWRFETPYPIPEGSSLTDSQDTRGQRLLRGAEGATYAFHSLTDATWVDTWEGVTGLPSAIRIDLALRDPALRPNDPRTDRTGGELPLRQVSWTFQLPAALNAQAEAEAAAAAAETAGTTTGGQ